MTLSMARSALVNLPDEIGTIVTSLWIGGSPNGHHWTMAPIMNSSCDGGAVSEEVDRAITESINYCCSLFFGA
ncbi:hypothetical protein TNCV_3629771 [Trichonephila clavipes]|nr:hypothetical protein TNCV_3629771 [Trichonephila clavipes]